MISAHPVVFIVHTSFVSVRYLTNLFRRACPEAKLHHIVDDSLLAEVLASGGVTREVQRRMRAYYEAAQAAGADLIFNQCSSVGEAADKAARHVRTPVIKVDTAMAEEACQIGQRIGVVATLKTTMGPTCRLIEASARRTQRRVKIVPCLIEGAFAELVAGRRATHNRMVLAAIRRLARETDVVVCAQGSMVTILAELGATPVPVLTSPQRGVAAAADWLRGQRASRTKSSRRFLPLLTSTR